MGLVAVALVGRHNSPMFLKKVSNRGSDRDVQYLIFASLDAVDEKLLDTSPAGKAPYLGLLTHLDGYAFFGYISNSLIKTIVVWDLNTPVGIDMAAFTKGIYMTYVRYALNPFCRIAEAHGGVSRQSPWLSNDKVFNTKVEQTIAKFLPDDLSSASSGQQKVAETAESENPVQETTSSPPAPLPSDVGSMI